MRKSYYKGRERPKSPLQKGPIESPTDVEIETMSGQGVPIVWRAYSVPAAASSLSKDALTFKRWIKAGMIPGPIFRDTRRKFGHYTEEEVKAIAAELNTHFHEYQYFRESHTLTVHRIAQRLEGIRREFISGLTT